MSHEYLIAEKTGEIVEVEGVGVRRPVEGLAKDLRYRLINTRNGNDWNDALGQNSLRERLRAVYPVHVSTHRAIP